MRVLIVGGDSLIGASLKTALANDGYDVLSTTRRRHGEGFFLDLAQSLPATLPETDIVIMAAAVTDLSVCEQNPEMTHAINTLAPIQLHQYCHERGSRFIFLSTNLVFDGQQPQPRHDSPTNPQAVYGQQKAAVEHHLLTTDPTAFTLRLTKVIYPHFPRFKQWRAQLEAGQVIRPFTDLPLAPITLSDVVEGVQRGISQSVGGVFQLSANGDISYADVGVFIAETLGYSSELVQPQSSQEAGVIIPHARRYAAMSMAHTSNLLGIQSKHPFEAVKAVL